MGEKRWVRVQEMSVSLWDKAIMYGRKENHLKLIFFNYIKVFVSNGEKEKKRCSPRYCISWGRLRTTFSVKLKFWQLEVSAFFDLLFPCLQKNQKTMPTGEKRLATKRHCVRIFSTPLRPSDFSAESHSVLLKILSAFLFLFFFLALFISFVSIHYLREKKANTGCKRWLFTFVISLDKYKNEDMKWMEQQKTGSGYTKIGLWKSFICLLLLLNVFVCVLFICQDKIFQFVCSPETFSCPFLNSSFDSAPSVVLCLVAIRNLQE